MRALRDLGHDLRHALRLYRATPVFTAVVVASLALGIGVNTALYSLADALLLRPLPVRQPDRLVQVNRRGPGGAGPVMSYPAYRSLRDASAGAVELLATGWVWRWNLGLPGQPAERVAGELVSGSYFGVLGVAPALGRLLAADDEGPVAVLSHGYWQRRFGGERNVLGARISLNGNSFTVVGVSEPQFFGVTVGDPVDVWTPVANQPLVLQGPNWLEQAGNNWLRLLGRLRPGVTPAQAQAVTGAAFSEVLAARGISRQERIEVVDGRWGLSRLREKLGRPVLFLGVLVALVLLIACVNVATLQLGRASRRQRELAVRVALGGGRGRLARQLLAENLLLAAVGAVLGLFLAYLAKDLLLTLLFPGAAPSGTSTSQPLEVTLNLRVLLVTAGLAVVSGVLVGLLPVRQLWRLEPAAGLQQGGRTTEGRSPLAGNGLPAAQIALSCVLLVGAGLFARSLQALRTLDPGFDRTRVLSVRLDAQALRYTQPQFDDLYRGLLATGRSLPGVRNAALADQVLFGRGGRQRNIVVDGFVAPPGADLNPFVFGVSPDFFATLGMPLLAGRAFDERDLQPGAPPVAVVNRSFARYYFGGDAGAPVAAVGRRFRYGMRPDRASDVQIVGVVEDAKYNELRESGVHMVYSPVGPGNFPTRAFSFSETTLALRMSGDPGPLGELIRRRLHAEHPQLAVIGVATLADQVESSLGQDRLVSALAALFGALALLLTCTGVYGVLAYGVSRRRREIGVRVALGALPAQLGWLVARRGLLMLGGGLLVGLPAALAGAHVARGVLYQVAPADPAVLAASVAALLLMTVLACLGPARAAVRTDPMIALKAE